MPEMQKGEREMISRRFLKKKLQKVSAKQRKLRPKTREEVLDAVKSVEYLVESNFTASYQRGYLKECLTILCERTRTLLNQEAPEGFEWKLIRKPQVGLFSTDCDTCKYENLGANEFPCRDCYPDRIEGKWEAK